jgi:hypothetical protein
VTCVPRVDFGAGTVEFSSASRNLISLRDKPLSLASPSGRPAPPAAPHIVSATSRKVMNTHELAVVRLHDEVKRCDQRLQGRRGQSDKLDRRSGVCAIGMAAKSVH